MKQKCSTCKVEKLLSEFSNNKAHKNGKANICLICSRSYDRLRKSTPEALKKSKAYQQSESGKKLRRLRQKRDYWQNRHKYTAKKVIASMIELGELKRLPCEVCGNENSKGHHPDYSKLSEVVWLCQKHHSEIHRKDASSIKGVKD